MKGNGAGSRVDEFKTRYPAEYSKVEHDRGLSSRMRRLFEDALDTCDPTADVANCANQFFRANKLGGRRKRPSRNTVFGHLQSREAFSRKLNSAHKMSDEDVTACELPDDASSRHQTRTGPRRGRHPRYEGLRIVGVSKST